MVSSFSQWSADARRYNPFASPSMTEPYPSTPPSSPQESSGKAVAALVLGILGLTSCGLLGIVALFLGQQAQEEIAQSGGRLTGKGMADAGVVMGWICVALLLVGVLFACLIFTLGAGGAVLAA
jgi:hypothetical protein